MRGWSGKGSRPISVVPPSDPNQVEYNLQDALINLTTLDQSTPMADIIYSLPLVNRINGNYLNCTNRENGITIGEKFRIIRKGDLTSNGWSCIRSSSNYLIFSVYKYLNMLDYSLDFDIDQLRLIS